MIDDRRKISKHKLIEILLIVLIIILAASNYFQWQGRQHDEKLNYITEITLLLENQTQTIYVPLIIHDPPKDHSYQRFIIDGPKYITFEWITNDIFFTEINFVNNDPDNLINEFNYTWASQSSGGSSGSSDHHEEPWLIGPSRGDGFEVIGLDINYDSFLYKTYSDNNGNSIVDSGDPLEKRWIQVNYSVSNVLSGLYTTTYINANPDHEVSQALRWLNVTPTPYELKFIKNGTSSSGISNYTIFTTSNSPILESWSSGYDSFLLDKDFNNFQVIKGEQPSSSLEIPVNDFPITDKYRINISLIRKFNWDGQHCIIHIIEDDEDTDWFSYSMYWDLRFGTIYMEVNDYQLTSPEEIY